MMSECSKCGSITLFKGKDGRTILNGSGTPGAGVGNNGDFYIDTDTDTYSIYGPKTGGVWGPGTSLIGPTGAQGLYGGYSSEWLFDNGTGAGTSVKDFRFDNSTLSAVTGLYINETNANSTDLSAFLAGFNNSGSFGLLRVSKKSNSDIFWMGTITATSDSGSEHDITVTHVVSNGSFTNNDPCIISFVMNGADGTAGQDIDHTSFTSSTGGGGAGVAGETDTYTVWGDAGETINLGTFEVYNGDDGAPGIPGPAGGVTWQRVPYAAGQFNVNAAVNNGYIVHTTDAAAARVYLPAVAAVGDQVEFVFLPSTSINNLRVIGDAGASQTIAMGHLETTATTGYLEYANTTTSRCAMKLVCVEANTTWAVISIANGDAGFIEPPAVI